MSNVFPLYEQRWGTGDNLVCKVRRRFYRVGNQYKRRNLEDNPLFWLETKSLLGPVLRKFSKFLPTSFWSYRPWKCSAGGALTPPEFGTPPWPKTVWVDLRSLETVYCQRMVSRSGTRLSWPISVAREAQMSRCIHVYPFVARNHGGIPFSGVCPLFFPIICVCLCTFSLRVEVQRYWHPHRWMPTPR